DLQPPLAPVREVPGLLSGEAFEVKDLEQLAALAVHPRLFGRVLGRPENRRSEVRFLPAVEGDFDVLQDRHVPEEPDVLKGPSDPAARDPDGPLAGNVRPVELDGA